ncbi:GMC family oxidoreductase N-terminal domain-containing protein [Asanoa sp. NPDC050611]|uniref:GMC family oxidoreductase N-terminal domain-containing protein n=1 Tax=Asanoa sp. NPDC050611 TaxID=3157098 RepID=UPI0033FC44B3
MGHSAADIGEHYDVVVVGSGYGGAICAARLAIAGRRVCVLERGRELRPGDFPETAVGLASQVQLRTDTRRVGPRTGLFDLRSGRSASVIVGCGVGGTSLINAGVAMRPSAAVLADSRWPAAIRGAVLTPYFDLAERMLGATPYPDAWPRLSKMEALRTTATALGDTVEPVKLTISFGDDVNHPGGERPACRLCGNCVTGCNHGAKGALTTNYLPLAVAHGARIVTGAEVRTVLPRGDGCWVVATAESFVTADVVVLAAGALGSTEILHRSRAAGLWVSDRLGEAFTGNGGGLAFAYAGSERIAGWARSRPPPGAEPPGPAIVGAIRRPGEWLIEDGIVPTGLAAVTAAALALRAGSPSLRTFKQLLTGAHHDPAGRTLTLLLTGDHPDAGRLVWTPGPVGVRIVGGVGEVDASGLARVAAATGARLVTDVLAGPTARLSVHPLGGCAMGENGREGVVDDRGRLFADTARATHDGLYVVDGAIVPRPLAVNPMLTIAAIAERAAELLVGELPTPRPVAPAATSPAGPRFTERLTGFLGRNTDGDPDTGADQGRHDGTAVECLLDLATGLPLTGRSWAVTGTVVAPAVAPRRLRVVGGRFHPVDATVPGGFRARYVLPLLADDGRRFTMTGTKEILVPRPAWRLETALAPLTLWRQSTTMSVVVRTEPAGEVVAAGQAAISPLGLARQLASVRAPLPAIRPRRSTPVRHRALRIPPAEPRWCARDGGWRTGDRLGPDAWLRLTRYPGGDRGPVVLAPGFGMSATSFLVDTIETNLVEYLCGQGWDVWLFDYRAGIDLPSARSEFTVDDIARTDWPTAVAEVLRVTGARDVQALGHCVGSLTLLMALAAGLRGVRSAVAMQTTLHPVASSLNVAKAALRIGRLAQAVGGRHLRPPRGPSTTATMVNTLLRAVPAPPNERCDRAICAWINAVYGSTHRHAQLNEATHETLDDLFDVGSLRALEHLGRIVGARGAHAYLDHPERLNLPLLLVQGECNDIFRPEGSLHTLHWLTQANGPGPCERVVLPGYAHLDALIGKDAARDVYPVIAAHLATTSP